MKKQRGVALITAVLIVALVTAIAVAMAANQQIDIRRTANVFDNDSAYLFALGAEDYARNVLEWDITQGSSKVDHPGENWAQEVAVPVEGAMLKGVMQDMQGRINLNSLVDAQGQPNGVMVQRFKNLLRLLDLNEEIAEAVVDWVDADINERPNGGAEDDYYMLQTPAYRSANAMMASASELLLIKSVDYEGYKALAPFVSALPSHDTEININTAPAAVLAALAPGLSVADGEALIEARGDKGFATIADFTAQPVLSNQQYDPTFLDVMSSYFLLNAMAEFDQSRSILHSLLQRDNNSGAVRVLMRSRGAY